MTTATPERTARGDTQPACRYEENGWPRRLLLAAGVLLAGYLLFCHGCHGHEDHELFLPAGVAPAAPPTLP